MAYRIKKIAMVGTWGLIRGFGYVEVVGPRGGSYILDRTCFNEMMKSAMLPYSDQYILHLCASRRSMVTFLVKPVTVDGFHKMSNGGKEALLGNSPRDIVKARQIGSDLKIWDGARL